MDAERKETICDLCGVPVSTNEESRKIHDNGKKHQAALKLSEKHKREVIVFVDIQPPLRQHFKEFMEYYFGRIESWFFKNKIVNIIFENEKSVEQCLSKKIVYQGKYLRIKKKLTPIPKLQNKKQKMLKNNVDDGQEYNFEGSTFEIQFETLMGNLQPPEEFLAKQQSLYWDLQSTLNRLYRGCDVRPFGSAVTGLSFADSDMDFFVHLPRDCGLPYQLRFSDKEFHPKIVKMTRNSLQKYRNLFSHIIAIPNASVPIVKFLHIPTGLNCDVSFKGGFGVENSRLIYLIINTDPRIRSLFLFLKFWSKTHEIVGHGGVFTSYALNMLIIYYLQQINPPMLPSIEYLQSDRNCDNYIQHWNCGFNEHLLTNFKTANESTVLSLIAGFFTLYSEFDMKNNIISTYTAQSIPVSSFNNPEDYPLSYAYYAGLVKSGVAYPVSRGTNKIYIQDPFEQSRNVAGNVGFSRVQHFQFTCQQSFKLIENAISKNEYTGLLNKLLKKLIEKPNMNMSRVLKHNYTSNVKLKMCNEEKVFVDCVETFIKGVLENVMKCRIINACDATREQNEATLWKKVYKCHVNYRIWTQKKEDEVEQPTYELQFANCVKCADEVVKNSAKVDSDNPILVCNFYFSVHKDVFCFWVENLGNMLEFKVMCNYFFRMFKSLLSKWFVTVV